MGHANAGARKRESDAALADLRRKLCGGLITLGVFVRGNGHSFEDVDPETINYFHQDGVWFLRFRTGVRDTIVPNVDYWTEQA